MGNTALHAFSQFQVNPDPNGYDHPHNPWSNYSRCYFKTAYCPRVEGRIGAVSDSDKSLTGTIAWGASGKGPYLVLANRDMNPVTLIAHYLTWRLHLPCLACSSHCLI